MNHERSNRPLTPPLPSERSFGFLFSILSVSAAGFGVYAGWRMTLIGALIVFSAAFLLAGLLAPNLLRPLNRAWFSLGQVLEKIFTPIALGLMFFLLITPVALVGRLLGRDELRLKKRDVGSYWLERDPPGPAPESFKNQF